VHIKYFISVYASVLSVPLESNGDANAEDSAGGKL